MWPADLSQLMHAKAPAIAGTQAPDVAGTIRFSGRASSRTRVRYDGIEGSGDHRRGAGNLNGEVHSPFKLQASLENVQEFRVESNNYPAEFGTGTGGQVNVVTKSGSNKFHGALFEYSATTRSTRRTTSTPQRGPVRSRKLKQNQFGGSIGGRSRRTARSSSAATRATS
jgi:hypothetical protein